MSLKDKIFRFGIYGKHAKNLSKNELSELKNKQWVEILTEEQLSKFKEAFTISQIGSIPKSENIPENNIIRMNMHAWRAYLMGSDFITTNKFYFLVADYLMKINDYVPCSVIRSMFDIDPKTMHYICKKLKSKNIIIEDKDKKETYIKICDITEKEDIQTQECKIFCDSEPIDTTNFVFYNNMSFMDQLNLHIRQSSNGLGTKELEELTGIRMKMGLKFLQKICEIHPDEFKMVNSIENGHNAFKVFSAGNLEKRNRKKVDSMKNNTCEKDTLLSSSDRQEALKILAQRYGHFAIKKEIINEISQMTGYPYQIDRKNILENARKAGLKVLKLPDGYKYKYVIAEQKYEDSILKSYIQETSLKESKFNKSLRKHFINSERFTIADNGYCNDSEINSYLLYSFLSQFFSNSLDDWIDFDYKTVMEMPVGIFFKITKIRKINFLVMSAFEVYKSKYEYFNRKGFKIDSLFIEESIPSKLNPLIFSVIEEIKDMKMSEFVQRISSVYKQTIHEVAKPYKYLKKLKKLENDKLIEINVDDKNMIKFKKKDTFEASHNNEINLLAPIVLNYNSRVDFVNLMKDTTEETFREIAEQILPTIFSRSEQRIMKKYISIFLKENFNESSVEKKDRKSFVLESRLHRLYLNIKKALLFQTPIDFKVLEGYENVDVEEVLEYMVKRDIASGFRSLYTLSKTYLNKKFEMFFDGSLPPKSDIPVSDAEYYLMIKPKIYSIVEGAASIDFDQLIIKSKFFEPFEIENLLENFKSDFHIKKVDAFRFISVRNLFDPFM